MSVWGLNTCDRVIGLCAGTSRAAETAPQRRQVQASEHVVLLPIPASHERACVPAGPIRDDKLKAKISALFLISRAVLQKRRLRRGLCIVSWHSCVSCSACRRSHDLRAANSCLADGKLRSQSVPELHRYPQNNKACHDHGVVDADHSGSSSIRSTALLMPQDLIAHRDRTVVRRDQDPTIPRDLARSPWASGAEITVDTAP
jgi:hypothetical protein